MKFLTIPLLFLFFTSPMSAQDLEPRDEPYPAPVSFNDVSELESKFLSLFRDENVTNLHVHSIDSEKTKNGSPYAGTPITSEFNGFLTGNLAAQTFIRGEEPQAIISMRGSGEELYLVRLPQGAWNGEIALFDMEDGKLRSREVLSYRKCNSAKCVQLDSWLQDVNGDGKLDIIQKRQTTRGLRSSKPKTKILLMQPDGTFKRSKKQWVDSELYRMESAG